MKHIQKKTGNAIRKERLFLKNKKKKKILSFLRHWAEFGPSTQQQIQVMTPRNSLHIWQDFNKRTNSLEWLLVAFFNLKNATSMSARFAFQNFLAFS